MMSLFGELASVMRRVRGGRVDAALLSSLYENLVFSQFAILPIALVLAVYAANAVDKGLLIYWLIYVVTVAVVRLLSGLLFNRRMSRGYLNGASIWHAAHYLGVVLGGLGWAAASYVFLTTDQLDLQVLIVGIIAGVSAMSVPTLSASLLSVATFLVLSIGPLAAHYLVVDDARQGLGILLVFFIIMLMLMSLRSHISLRKGIQARLEKETLLGDMREHTRKLEEQRDLDEAERAMALTVFGSIMPLEKLDLPNIAWHLSSHSAFNGDMLLIEQRPDGSQNILLGDFTGHGLAASLGAIPVADIFRSMSQKGFSVECIVSEINNKIYHQLPDNLFLAGCLAELDGTRSRLRIWNAGLPSVYVLDGRDGTIRTRIDSLSPPLGILGENLLDERPLVIRMEAGDQLFMATDGVIEQRNKSGEQYGERRLETVLNQVKSIKDVAKALQHDLLKYCDGAAQGDDVTFVIAQTERQTVQKTAAVSSLDEHQPVASHWALTLKLEADALATFNPVPVLSHVIKEFNAENQSIEHADLVLGELYKNALDHGVLQLDSQLKQTPEGYVEYYALRDQLLGDLKTGEVEIRLANAVEKDGGSITLTVSDSGEGFDVERVFTRAGEGNDSAHGRGVALVRSLCESVEFIGNGSQVKAEYRW